MKLSDLVSHTSRWLDIDHTVVGTYARFLRQGQAISSAGKGGAAAEMDEDDKLALLVAVCGCGTARTAARALPRWLKLPFAGPSLAEYSPPFKFLVQRDLKASLLCLFSELGSGQIQAWRGLVKEAPRENQEVLLTARFDVDKEAASIAVECVTKNQFNRRRTSVRYSVDFYNEPSTGNSKLAREINLTGLAGWGQCIVK